MRVPKLAVVVLATGLLGSAGSLSGQSAPSYSVDFQGGVIGMPDAFGSGFLITEGDILLVPPGPPFLPFPGTPAPPGIVIAAAPPFGLNLGLMPPGAAPAPGMPSRVEVDALSYGQDHVLRPGGPAEMLLFSVDEFAAGTAAGAAPDVFSEGVLGSREASADVYMTFPSGPLAGVPAPPGGLPLANTQLFDGDGIAPPGAILPPLPAAPAPHSMALIEPNFPSPGVLPDFGDNLDALDIDTRVPAPPFPVYFSLDSAFADPLELLTPANSGSALAHGVAGGDVLVSLPGGPPVVFAAAGALGLDIAGGPGSDDLDALALFENGSGVFEPSTAPFPPFDWGPGSPADMLLFSVRRGSAVIGLPDSIFGLPITEGDILVPPLPPALGGVSPFPGIFIAAENLALVTAPTRGGAVGLFPFADDLNALDLAPDCNGNAIPDALDVAYGISVDTDGDGVIDDCDSDDDNDGVDDVSDPAPLDPDVCGDVDGDSCDDCSVGSDDFGPLPDNDPANDGPDNDADGACDAGDPDDDNDGVLDGADPDPFDPDVCGDSDADACDDCSVGTDDFGPLPDNDPGNDGPDTDADGACDAGDPDDDNDGVLDIADPDPFDPDVCGDSDADACDDCSVGSDDLGPLPDNDPGNDGPDNDADGVCDAGDPDDDNDGVLDGADPDPFDPDVCGDSDADACDDCSVGTDDFGPLPDNDPGDDGLDTDGDGTCDSGDVDDDNDGVPDAVDPDPVDPDACGDADVDSCDDCSVGTDDFGPLPDNDPANDGTDTDGDLLCDAGDPDDDNDGVLDIADPDPLDPDACGDLDGDGCDDCAVGTDDFGPLPDTDPANDGPDIDGDGICDGGDNCPVDFNPGQADCDNDGIGDLCAIGSGMSPDCQPDGIPDVCDTCPADLTGDGMVNAADLALLLGAWGPNPGHCADFNNDGAVNAADLALLLGSWGPCP